MKTKWFMAVIGCLFMATIVSAQSDPKVEAFAGYQYTR
jgi:hypothetical protein